MSIEASWSHIFFGGGGVCVSVVGVLFAVRTVVGVLRAAV